MRIGKHIRLAVKITLVVVLLFGINTILQINSEKGNIEKRIKDLKSEIELLDKKHRSLIQYKENVKNVFGIDVHKELVLNIGSNKRQAENEM